MALIKMLASPCRVGMLRKLQKQLESIADRDIIGDIYETGTWRAGTAMLMVGVLTAYESFLANERTLGRRRPRSELRPERHYCFFDSFAGFYSGQGIEIGDGMDTYLQNPIYVAPLGRVMRSFASNGLLGERVHLVKGRRRSRPRAISGQARYIVAARFP